MYLLGVDTSNYATSLALLQKGKEEILCAKKRFLPVPQGGLGLRQSDAVFHHVAALPELLAEMQAEGFDLTQVGAVAVSAKPRPQPGSYMPCFLTGVSFATAFAAARGISLIKTTHQQGHVAAALFGTPLRPIAKGRRLVFHVSGGTTELLLCDGIEVIETAGKSLDLYAGQAIDRLGVALGYSFPAGEQVSLLAGTCKEEIAPKISVKDGDCHLSGLQNQYEALLKVGKEPAYAAKYCLISIAATASAMIEHARGKYGNLPVVCAGGVMASTIIRQWVEQRLKDVFFVPPSLSADNAVGVALIAAMED